MEQNPTAEELRSWIEGSGLPAKKFFNTSGLLYTSMKLTDKLAGMSLDEQIALLASNGMLVKRPIFITNGKTVSYTHLDVYKRQEVGGLFSAYINFNVLAVHGGRGCTFAGFLTVDAIGRPEQV